MHTNTSCFTNLISCFTNLNRILTLNLAGWDVEFLFGKEAPKMLKAKFPYYPLTGTGVGLDFHRSFPCHLGGNVTLSGGDVAILGGSVTLCCTT